MTSPKILHELWTAAPTAVDPLAVGDVLLVRRELTFANAIHANAVNPADLYELEDAVFFGMSDEIDAAAANLALVESGQWGGTPPMDSIDHWRMLTHLVPEAVEALQLSNGRIIVYARLRVQANLLPAVWICIGLVGAGVGFAVGSYLVGSAIEHASDTGLEIAKLLATAEPDSPIAEAAEDAGAIGKLFGLALLVGAVALLLSKLPRK